MNVAGGHAFSLSMAKFLAMLDAGQDVESLFETPSEYLAAVNYITNVYMTPEVHPDKILLLAGSYHGPSVQAEYEFWVKAPGGERIQPGFRVFYPLLDRVRSGGARHLPVPRECPYCWFFRRF